MQKISKARRNLNNARGNLLKRKQIMHALYGNLSNAAVLKMFNVKRKRLQTKALVSHNKLLRRK